MNNHPVPSPRVLKCRSTADFLAALPELAGFTAEDSLFIVFFSGHHSGRAVRIDLPASEDPMVSADLLEFITDLLGRVEAEYGAIDPPAIAIRTSRTFAESDGAPWRRFAKRVERRLRRERIGVRELCCLAPDGWLSFLDPASPRMGHPLSKISDSPVAREVEEMGDPAPDLNGLGAIPEPDPDRWLAVSAALDDVPPHDLPGPESAPSPASEPADHLAAYGTAYSLAACSIPRSERPGRNDDQPLAWFSETAQIVRSLCQADGALSPHMTARLIRSAAHSDRWLLMALGVMTRPEFPEELAREMSPDRFIGVPVDIDVEPNDAPRIGWSIRRILVNICPEFTEHSRLLGVRERLGVAIAEAPLELRPGLLAFSAWVWWLSGNQTVAHRHVSAALAIDSENELALMVGRLADTVLYGPLLSPGFPRLAQARRDTVRA